MAASYAQSMRGLEAARAARARNVRANRKAAVRRVRAWAQWCEADARAYPLGRRIPMPDMPTDHDYRIARGDV